MTSGAHGVGTGSVTIASNSKTASLCREIKTVQDFIERCLQLYMSKDEVVKTLLQHARIQPGFTSIVWNRLEQENTEFFKAYYTKLVLKKQIAKFNELLEDHHKLLSYAAPLEAPLAPMQEGIKHMPVIHLNKVYTLPRQHPIPSSSNSQNDSTGTISNYDPLYENPECGNFLSSQMNYGRWMAMDNNAADLEPTQPFMKPGIPSSVSVTSHGHFPFIPREIQESVAPSAVEFAELSHVQSVRHVPFGTGSASFNTFADVEGTISNYDPLYDYPECGNFLSTQMNYGRWMAMDNNAADLEPTQPFMKPGIPSSVSVTSHGHFPFIPREIQESVAPSAVEFAELSHVQSVRHVPFGTGSASFNTFADVEGTISNYDPLYDYPECGNFLSTQMNYGRWIAMDNNASDLEPIQPFMQPEIPSSVSVSSHGHFPFIPREIQESVAPAAVEFSELSHVQSVRHVPFGRGNTSFNNFADAEGYSGSSSTGLLDPSAQNDNVEEFFVDAFPAAASRSEEES